ncbi:MAG: hypothetical protein ACE5IY_18545 [bacterium]
MKVLGRKSTMIFHFSLYGFLKNQKYFEPFLILAFLEKGLSFTLIGMLIGFRGICINLLEIPSGATGRPGDKPLGRRNKFPARRRARIDKFATHSGAKKTTAQKLNAWPVRGKKW